MCSGVESCEPWTEHRLKQSLEGEVVRHFHAPGPWQTSLCPFSSVPFATATVSCVHRVHLTVFSAVWDMEVLAQVLGQASGNGGCEWVHAAQDFGGGGT